MADKSRPYLFQLLEKWESPTTNRSELPEPSKESKGPAVEPPKPVESKDKPGKPTGGVIPNKPPAMVSESTPKGRSNDPAAPKRLPDTSKESTTQQPMRLKTDEQMESLRSQKKKTERMTTEERELTEGNDMFQSESLGLDLTIDSTAINQFDYNESVEREE